MGYDTGTADSAKRFITKLFSVYKDRQIAEALSKEISPQLSLFVLGSRPFTNEEIHGKIDNFEQLLQLIEDLKAEEKRPEAEGLSEEELEIFDLLIAGKKLANAEEQKVKLSAKNLFKKLSEEKSGLMVVEKEERHCRSPITQNLSYQMDISLP